MTKKKYQMRMRSTDYNDLYTADDLLFMSMHELLTQIGVFWKNAPENNDLKTDLLTFMNNRVEKNAGYRDQYKNAQEVIEAFKEEFGDQAYAKFFTDKYETLTPPTKIAQARQYVSNEFITLQLSLGGFKAFGAENYPGYIGGANVPGKKPPYRSTDII